MESGPTWGVGWSGPPPRLFSRRIVGWRVDDNMENALILMPLRTALQAWQPAGGLILHSDRGGQYISSQVRELVSLWRLRPSMSRAAPRRLTIPRTTVPADRPLRRRSGAV